MPRWTRGWARLGICLLVLAAGCRTPADGGGSRDRSDDSPATDSYLYSKLGEILELKILRMEGGAAIEMHAGNPYEFIYEDVNLEARVGSKLSSLQVYSVGSRTIHFFVRTGEQGVGGYGRVDVNLSWSVRSSGRPAVDGRTQIRLDGPSQGYTKVVGVQNRETPRY